VGGLAYVFSLFHKMDVSWVVGFEAGCNVMQTATTIAASAIAKAIGCPRAGGRGRVGAP